MGEFGKKGHGVKFLLGRISKEIYRAV